MNLAQLSSFDRALFLLGPVVAWALGAIALFLLVELFMVFSRQRRMVREVRMLALREAGSDEGEVADLMRKRLEEADWVERLLEALPRLANLQTLLEQSNTPWGISGLVRRALLFASILGGLSLLLTGSFWFVVGAALLGLWLPLMQIKKRKKKRLARFEEDFPEAIDLLARALRAGTPFSTGIKMVADDMAEPVAGEFRRVFEEQKHGLPLTESLAGFVNRIELLDVRIFVTAVLVQREVGGNLAEILEKISRTIRERFSIRRQVQVYTAQGRMTGFVLSMLPVAVGGVLYAMNPEYMEVLYTTFHGRIALCAAIGMQLIGFFIIRKIVDIEV